MGFFFFFFFSSAPRDPLFTSRRSRVLLRICLALLVEVRTAKCSSRPLLKLRRSQSCACADRTMTAGRNRHSRDSLLAAYVAKDHGARAPGVARSLAGSELLHAGGSRHRVETLGFEPDRVCAPISDLVVRTAQEFPYCTLHAQSRTWNRGRIAISLALELRRQRARRAEDRARGGSVLVFRARGGCALGSDVFFAPRPSRYRLTSIALRRCEVAGHEEGIARMQPCWRRRLPR